MNWYDIIVAVITSGILLFVLERLFFRKRDKADTKGKDIENASSIASLYKEIDSIVQEKTQPIEDKLDKALAEMDDIKRHWCCYRSGCEERMLYSDNCEEQDNGGL